MCGQSPQPPTNHSPAHLYAARQRAWLKRSRKRAAARSSRNLAINVWRKTRGLQGRCQPEDLISLAYEVILKRLSSPGLKPHHYIKLAWKWMFLDLREEALKMVGWKVTRKRGHRREWHKPPGMLYDEN